MYIKFQNKINTNDFCELFLELLKLEMLQNHKKIYRFSEHNL